MGIFILLGTALLLIFAVGSAALTHRIARPHRRTLGAALAGGLPTTPGELGFTFDEQTIRLADGSETQTWIVHTRGPSARTLIIVHGFGDSRFGALTWLPQVQHLAGRVVIYDGRGHGDSTASNMGILAQQADDIVELMNRLKIDDQVMLFGYSMGATVSLLAATSEAERSLGRVVGVIAEAPYRDPAQPIYEFLKRRRIVPHPFILPMNLAYRLTGGPRYWFDIEDRVADLNCSTLIFHAADDHLCPVSTSRAIAAARPDLVTYVEFPTGGHLDIVARHAAAYRAAIDQWAQQLPHGDASSSSADDLPANDDGDEAGTASGTAAAETAETAVNRNTPS